ncbi:MAG: polysaccharide pyruvyl transferase family protein [Patescibacteria group bacterium]
MRYLLLGNYGVGNLGDEMLREYFLQAYPDVAWTVLSPQKGDLPRLPFGLRSLFTPWWKSLSALRKSEGIIFGGGTLFTDIESVKAPLLWGWHALWAWMFRKKIVLAFQGIGPFRTRVGEWCAQWVVKRAEAVIVRDRESLRRALAWNKNCIQSFDPVFSVFHKQKDNHRSQKLFIVIPRANSPESFLQWVTELYGKRKGEWSGARIISLEPEAPGEKEVCEELKRSLDAELIAPGSPTELEHALADGSFVVTQRYHGAIAALGMDIPFIAVPQSPGDKLAGIGSVHRDEAQKLLKEGEAALRAALRSSFPF